MTNHFISIIIPVYNGGKTLHRCLESVFNSSYPHFECIVVDDHSTDNTIDLAEPFGTRIIRLEKQGGAAHARNRGAEAAKGDIILFVDADVRIYPDCLDRIIKAFEDHPGISAVFGSYDDHPGSPNFLSQYRNLFHHYIHQTSLEDASTFWSGCGAIKREIFMEAGAFDENCRMMEDIQLGYALKARNYKIRLDKELLVNHLKHYSFLSLLKADLFDRAVPWTVLMLTNRQFTSDLNLKVKHKLSGVLLILLIVSVLMAATSVWFTLAIPILLLMVLLINYDVYAFFWQKKGLLFTLKVIPLHFLYYLYSTMGFFMGSCKYLWNKRLSRL